MQQQTVDAAQERSRLIDHFKRAYQIIVGLAITLACTKLFPNDDPSIPWDTSFWLFCIFFITVVPIFHGGDRSLDVKYLPAPAVGFWGRAAYIWDVYMLLITAILFVKIAQAIPGPAVLGGAPRCGWRGVRDNSREHVPRETFRVSGRCAVAAITTPSRLHGRFRKLK